MLVRILDARELLWFTDDHSIKAGDVMHAEIMSLNHMQIIINTAGRVANITQSDYDKGYVEDVVDPAYEKSCAQLREKHIIDTIKVEKASSKRTIAEIVRIKAKPWRILKVEKLENKVFRCMYDDPTENLYCDYTVIASSKEDALEQLVKGRPSYNAEGFRVDHELDLTKKEVFLDSVVGEGVDD